MSKYSQVGLCRRHNLCTESLDAFLASGGIAKELFPSGKKSGLPLDVDVLLKLFMI